MKFKLLILLWLLLAGQIVLAQTTRLKSFEELMQSLNSGQQVRVVIHYGLCKWPPGKTEMLPVPDAVVGMDIDIYEYFAPGAAHNKTAFVVFANSKLIQNPLGKGFVYNYGKVRVNADNTVLVTAKYIQPKSFKVLMDESFLGKINNEINNEGIDLYIMNKR